MKTTLLKTGLALGLTAALAATPAQAAGSLSIYHWFE